MRFRLNKWAKWLFIPAVLVALMTVSAFATTSVEWDDNATNVATDKALSTTTSNVITFKMNVTVGESDSITSYGFIWGTNESITQEKYATLLQENTTGTDYARREVTSEGEGFVALTEGNNVVTLSLTLTLPTSGLDNASGDITPVNVIGFVKGTDSKVTAVKTLSLTYTDGTFKYTVS